ncbi:MAG TPA: hypothetical protein VFS43_39980 [Polyangiaceae bacterium]|nr:hypothetical protein [Polyangiaceae bacterium]
MAGRARRTLAAAAAALAAWALAPAGCSSVETEGTNWSCSSDADCSGGKLCSRAFDPEGDRVLSPLKRCVAPDAAPIVIGVSGLQVEKSWDVGVEGCVRRVNERLDGGDRIGGHPLRVRQAPYDIAAFNPAGAGDQYAKFLGLLDADAGSAPGPNAVDALYGFLQLEPEVVRQLGTVGGKDVVLFGASDGNASYREQPPENLYFYRPSALEEMGAIVDSIFASGVSDPKSVYVTRWAGVSADLFDAFRVAWNSNRGRPAAAPQIADEGSLGGFELHDPRLPTGPGGTYFDHVLVLLAAGYETAYASPALDAFLATPGPGPLAVVVLDGPADAAGFLLGLNNRLRGPVEGRPEVPALDGSLLTRLRFYAGSGTSLMGPIIATQPGGASDLLKRSRVAGATPDPDGASALAQAYQRDVAVQRSQLGFEAYLGCVYYVEALRESVRRFGNVAPGSLRQVFADFTADIGLGPMSISAARNYASPTVYLYEYPEGDPFGDRLRGTWTRDDGLVLF